jgi:uncharacterized delta-60 repeat protein
VGLLLFPVEIMAQEAGDLDTSFGSDGQVITDFDGGGDEAHAVALQTDGKIVVAGGSSLTEIGGLFALARYNPNGTLDTTFGGGRVTTDVEGGTAHDVGLQSDGKIVAVGASGGAFDHSSFTLVRYKPNGTPDMTFGSDGLVTTAFRDFNDIATAIALQPDDKIVVAGSSTSDPATGATDFALARYNPNGTLDTTFGGDGRVITAFEGHAAALDIALQPDGKIVAVGQANNPSTGNRDFALARYHPDGTLDTTFGGDGRVTTAFEGDAPANAVALQPDGKIVLAGSVGFSPDFALARYHPDGTLDTTFVTTDGGSGAALDVVLQPDGKFVVAGFIGSDFALARFHPNGTVDTTFGGDGRVTTDFGRSSGLASALVLQPDGKLVAAGSVDGAGLDFALARYDSGLVPMVGPPTSKEECKHNGWRAFNVPRAFENEGDCIRFVNTGE